jgi:hypothetical protein
MKRTVEDHAPEDQFRVPDRWGKDELTSVIAKASRNAYYTVNRNRAAVKRLIAATDLFSDGAEQYSRVRGAHLVTDELFFKYDVALPFYMSCRASLIAATTLAFGHQLPDSVKPARGALEAAFYGYHVFTRPEAWERWTERPLVTSLRAANKKEEARRQRIAVGREFSVTSIARELAEVDEKLARATTELYDELIDAGGHFNMPAFQAAARVSRDEYSTTIHFTALGGSDDEVAEVLNRLLRTNISCLRIFELVFRDLWAKSRLPERIVAFGARA